MKKNIYLSLMGILMAWTLQAQAPQILNYQAVARGGTGDVMVSQDISVMVRINIGDVAGPPVYTETHDVTTNAFGLFTLKIGTGAVQSGVFENIAWGDDSYFMEIHLDESGGDTWSLMGTTQLVSVPYSLYAERSGDSYWEKLGNDLHYTAGEVGIGTTNPDGKLHIIGSLTSGKMGTEYYGVTGTYSSNNNYGFLGGLNAGGYGNSYSFSGLWGNTANGYGVRGSASGTGYAGYFDGRSYFSGDVGIGTTTPEAKLEIASSEQTVLSIYDTDGSNTRPGIQFRNNTIHFISGDDNSDEYFGFYSNFDHTRAFDAKLSVFGKSTSSWGKYIGIKHDGTDGFIDTDAGDIVLQPGGGNVRIEGNLTTSTKTGYLFIPTAAFTPETSGYNYNNSGSSLISYEDWTYFSAPVYIPDGAVVVSITSWWTDASPNYGQIQLRRKDPVANDIVTLSYNSTSASNGSNETLIDNTIDYESIENQNYFYFLDLTLSTLITIYGVKIEYTYTNIY